MSTTSIEWAEQVWNPTVGCSVHSPGCTNCYAMRMAARLEAMAPRPDGTGNIALAHYLGTTQRSRAGAVWTGKIGIAHDDALMAPLRRKKPTRYFVNSMSDLFHENVTDAVIDRVFATMAMCPQHTFKVLTKRSARMRAYCRTQGRAEKVSFEGRAGWPLPNVWLGVSVEDQTRADERREDFRATPAAVKFVSYEPALGPVDWTGWEFVNQIIGGGESGPKARPAHPQWFRDTRDWCASASVPFFFKQWGEWMPTVYIEGAGDDFGNQFLDGSGRWAERIDGPWKTGAHATHGVDAYYRAGKKRAGRLLDGVEHNGMPQVRHD